MSWSHGARRRVVIRSYERRGDWCAIVCEPTHPVSTPITLLVTVREVLRLGIRPTVDQHRVIEFNADAPIAGQWSLLDGLDPRGRCRVCQGTYVGQQITEWVEWDLCAACARAATAAEVNS